MRYLPLNHSAINVHFNKSHKDFIVRERPAYEFSGQGEHLILQVAKKDLTTKDLLKDLSSVLGIKSKDIGYAGLKDRAGLTEQFISIPKKTEAKLASFNHEKVKILNTYLHDNKIKLGHLKGNSFFIRLKKVSELDALKLNEAFNTLANKGFANYFGYQRFGKDANNAQAGLAVLTQQCKHSKFVDKFLISAFQSELFNQYLSARIALSKLCAKLDKKQLNCALSQSANLEQILINTDLNPQIANKISNQIAQLAPNSEFKMANGFLLMQEDTYLHYPKGKVFSEELNTACERFLAKDICPAGLLLGAKAAYGNGVAGLLQSAYLSPYEQILSKQTGSFRHLISYASELKTRYDAQQAHFCVEFFLQKGSYATSFLEQALNAPLEL